MCEEIKKLRSAWIELEQQPDGTSRAIAFETGEGDLRIHRDKEGNLHLLIPTQKEIRSLLELSTEVLSISETEKISNGQTIRFLYLCCLELRCNEAFLKIAEKIVERIKTGTPSIKSVAEVISEFRDILISISSEILNRSQRVGLLGELLFLKEIISKNPQSLANWIGPKRKAHDFYAPTCATEIKSSEARGKIIKVSSLEQLDPPENKKLYLVLYQLDEDPNGSLSIPGIVEEINNFSLDSLLFEKKLAQVGYRYDKADAYGEFRYNLRDTHYYSVDESFPKLSLKPGKWKISPHISKAQYEINLNGFSSNSSEHRDFATITSKMAEVA